jgi:putative holliday junction resolvase
MPNSDLPRKVPAKSLTNEPTMVFGDWSETGRLAGIDYGTVRIGIAICDPSRTWAGPLDTYNRRTEPLDRAYFQKLGERENVAGWVLGLPLHCDGMESQKSIEVRDFAQWLFHYTGIPVRFFDERFTSALANRILAPAELSRSKKKKTIDRVAAHLILEGYLEMVRSQALPRGQETQIEVWQKPLE